MRFPGRSARGPSAPPYPDAVTQRYAGAAAGWPGATIEEIKLTPILDDDVLRFEPDERGRTTRVVVDIDAADFTDRWFEAVERVAAR